VLRLARLNARLAPQGYVIHGGKGLGAKPIVTCTGEYGGVEQFRQFERRHVCPRAS
jgi:hypothetical protein